MPRPQLGELHGTHMKGRKTKSFLTLYPTRGLSSEPSMAVGALGRLPGAPPGPPGSARCAMAPRD